MREKEEAGKGDAIELRSLRDERERMTRRERDLRDAAGEKDKVIEVSSRGRSILRCDVPYADSCLMSLALVYRCSKMSSEPSHSSYTKWNRGTMI
jgi:hypothetical protein